MGDEALALVEWYSRSWEPPPVPRRRKQAPLKPLPKQEQEPLRPLPKPEVDNPTEED